MMKPKLSLVARRSLLVMRQATDAPPRRVTRSPKAGERVFFRLVVSVRGR